MLIDWFTIVAQIINFLILVALLRHFLYAPIIKVMDEREKKIVSLLEEAREEKIKASQVAESHRQKIEEFEKSRTELFDKAQKEVEIWREEKMSEARHEYDISMARWREALSQEQDALMGQLRQKTSEQVMSIARQALTDLADADLEKQILQIFIEKIRKSEGALKDELQKSIQESGGSIKIFSAFEFPAKDQKMLADFLNEQFNFSSALDFHIQADTIAGIELQATGQKFAWSLNDYLDSLEESIYSLVNEQLMEIE